MEEEESGQEDSTMSLFVKLQELKVLKKKKNVDEMEALRAENIYMKQKLKEENTMPLNSTREYVDTST